MTNFAKRFISLAAACCIMLISSFAYKPESGEGTFSSITAAALDIDYEARGAIVAQARSYLGISGNYNIFQAHFNPNNPVFDWCCAYCSYVFEMFYPPNTVVAHSTFVDNWEYNGEKQFFENRGRFFYSAYFGGSYTPRIGDLILFTYDGQTGMHIEIVTSVSNGYVYTIGGNSGNFVGTGNGSVQEHCNSLYNSTILGYCSIVLPSESGSSQNVQSPAVQKPVQTVDASGFIEVIDPVGCWVHHSADILAGSRIGIASTGTVCSYDYIAGEMYHVDSVVLEGRSAPVSGFIHKSVVTERAAAPVTTAAAVVTTTTTTTTAAAPVVTTTAVTAALVVTDLPPVYSPSSAGLIVLRSEIGGWLHSSSDDRESSRIGLISTGTVAEYDYITPNGFYHVTSIDAEDCPYKLSGFISETIVSELGGDSSLPSRTGTVISAIGCWLRCEPLISDGIFSFENYGPYDTRITILDFCSTFEIIDSTSEWFHVRTPYGEGYVHRSVAVENY